MANLCVTDSRVTGSVLRLATMSCDSPCEGVGVVGPKGWVSRPVSDIGAECSRSGLGGHETGVVWTGPGATGNYRTDAPQEPHKNGVGPPGWRALGGGGRPRGRNCRSL